MVPRPHLLAQLQSSPAPIVMVVAPSGYGKTTLLAQWLASSSVPSAWISLESYHNDPTAFLGHITSALDVVVHGGESRFAKLVTPVMPAVTIATMGLGPAMASVPGPLVLVLDQFERLTNDECVDAVVAVAALLPPAWRLAIASKSEPSLPVARLRSEGRLLEFGPDDLAFDAREARSLFAAEGFEVDPGDLTTFVSQTEGWPTGLYLAALATRVEGADVRSSIATRGDDRFLADYLRSELLAPLPADTVSFLTRTSILEHLNGSLCDAVLETRGSGDVLRSLERSNLLLVPLDRQGQRYRYHNLFREFLYSELTRAEPELVPQLHRRAMAWYSERGMLESAMEHAMTGEDADRAAQLLSSVMPGQYAAGRAQTVGSWIEWFEERGLLDRSPYLAFHAATFEAALGRPAATERWAAVAEQGSSDHTMPDGSSFESYRSGLSALLCANGVAQMRADARFAHQHLAPGSHFFGASLALDGLADLMLGDVEQADASLAHAASAAAHVQGLPASALTRSLRGVIAVDRHDWTAAESFAQEALDIVETSHLEEYVYSLLPFVLSGRVAVHQGDVSQARALIARTARLRPLITYAIPWMAYCLLQLSQCYIELAEPAGARTVLREVRDILQLRPSLGTVAEQAEALGRRIDALREDAIGVSSLTAAELRLLPYLATHLSFREIGDRLYVSRHTVKSQAVAVYRKLGVSSRSEAIERIRDTGLLGM